MNKVKMENNHYTELILDFRYYKMVTKDRGMPTQNITTNFTSLFDALTERG